MDAANHFLPAAYDIVWSVIVALVMVLTVVALIVLVRSARQLTAGWALIWTLLILFVPVIGSALWLTAGRRMTLATRPDRP